MVVEKIAQMLRRRPPQGRFREQLFWLVDIIYACKASDDASLQQEAAIVESALGRLGEYLETGEKRALDAAFAQVEEFARVVKSAVAAQERDKE